MDDASPELMSATGKRSLGGDAANGKNVKKPKTKESSPPKIVGRSVLSRECKVVLEKLDGEGLKRARIDIADSSEEDEEKEEDVDDAPNATAMGKTLTSADAKKMKRFYNIDKMMHSRTEPMTCALCSATPRFIVNHYVNEHDGFEVCHARMPPETTDLLREGHSPHGVHEQKKISAICHYCEKMRSFGGKDWVLHITRHTGEYLRRCNQCNLKCADSKFKPSQQCMHTDVGVWNNIEVEAALGVFVCKSCNYSQLLEANLQKHVRQMHSITKNPEKHYDFIELIPNMRTKRARRAPVASTSAAAAAADSASEAGSSVSEAEPANTNVFEPSEQGDGLFDTDTIKLMKETTFKETVDDAASTSQGAAKNMMADKLSERFRKQDAISDPKPEIESIDVAMECPEDNSSPSARRRNVVTSDSSSPASQINSTAITRRQPKDVNVSRRGKTKSRIHITHGLIFSTVKMENYCRSFNRTQTSFSVASATIRTNAKDARDENSESDNGWESCTGSEDDDDDEGSAANESDSKNKMIGCTLTRLKRALGKNKSKTKKKCDPKRLSTSTEWKPLPVKVEKIKTEDDGNVSADKVVKCVENIAWVSGCMGVWEFKCFAGDCCEYRSTRLKDIMSHVREHAETWSGTCLLCKEDFSTDGMPLPLSKEVEHWEEFHLPKTKQINESQPAAAGVKNYPEIEPATPSAVVVAAAADVTIRPMIKCRRVSGDRLSTMAPINQAPGQLQISSAISLSSAAIINFPVATTTVLNTSGSGCSGVNDNPLKPWTKCPLSKSMHATELLMREISLVALFKCMAKDCYFSTGDAKKMLQHLQYHEDYVSTQQISTNEQLDHLSWLECCYCDTMVDTCNLLVQHIESEHKASIYQCPYCFYRSAATANVEAHLNEYHSRKDKMIMQCPGTAKQLHGEIILMLAAREKNVVPIQCGDEGMGCASPQHIKFHELIFSLFLSLFSFRS